MKISINAVIFNTFASRLVGTSALYNSLAVQKGLASAESMAGSAERALSKVPFFTNVKEATTKIMNISKTEDEVVVEINDQYIIGSINLAFNMYDRIADSATTMIKEMGEWDKEAKQFESKWNEDVPTDNKVDNETSTFDTSEAWSKTCEEVNADKSKSTSTVHSVTYGDVTVEVSEPDVVHTIYAKDVDKQVQVTALVCIREGEEIPYTLSRPVVNCICQSEFDPAYYVGGSFDLPLNVINAVRNYYGLPVFWNEEQVEEFKVEADKKRKADFEAKYEADRKAKEEAKVANHPNGLKEFVENTLVDNKATKNNQDK